MQRRADAIVNKHDNRGFSLMELIVVVAILGVCLAMVSLSITTVFSGRVKKCASELDSMLSECKVSAMSRAGDVYLKLYTADGIVMGELYENGNIAQSRQLGAGGVGLTYTVGGVETTLTSVPLYLSFERDTGAFKRLQDVKHGVTVLNVGKSGYCTALTVIGSITRIIELTPLTGHHGIEG